MNLEPTRRELEVLSLAAEGLTNPEIAARLFLTTDTVKQHMQHIAEKLGTVREPDGPVVGTRAHSVSVAIRRGLI